MAIDNSGKRKVRGFIVYPVDLKVSRRPGYSGDVLKNSLLTQGAMRQQALNVMMLEAS